jgi:di/tricarboxylate transporter
MSLDQILISAILAAAVLMFLAGRWRHDLVALVSLLACVLSGLVPAAEAFAGFGHPAVVTVACVLVLSRGLQSTGAVDVLAQRVLPAGAGPTLSIVALTALAAVLSAFMNNVGALALLLPLAVQLAAKHGLPPGKVLMPLAFGSILGGMTTLIGTPPNLIVSAFRAQNGAGGFGMFDFSPVGAAVAGVGVAFVGLVGWRLVPTREPDSAGFDTGTYLTEARVTEDSAAAGRSLRELEPTLEEADAQVVGLVRQSVQVSAPSPSRILRPGDILVLEAEPEALSAVLGQLGLTLEEDKREPKEKDASPAASGPAPEGEDGEPQPSAPAKAGLDSDEVLLLEVSVRPDSDLVDRSASDLLLRTRFGVNLLAVSRQGRRSIRRLRSTRIRAGDVLLLQGAPAALSALGAELRLIPLAPRAIRIPDKRRAVVATAVMAAAVTGAAFGLLPAAVSFAAGAAALVALRVVPPRQVYEAIDWPVIVLLAALIPVAGAIAATGTADRLAQALVDGMGPGHPALALAAILVVTMILSDFLNNAATAAVMCPIALSSAARLGVSGEAFLMAVAVGASCAFLTPIGHQNNTLILGPGGFRFGDYWRLGLLLELVVLAVGIPMLLLVWPL